MKVFEIITEDPTRDAYKGLDRFRSLHRGLQSPPMPNGKDPSFAAPAQPKKAPVAATKPADDNQFLKAFYADAAQHGKTPTNAGSKEIPKGSVMTNNGIRVSLVSGKKVFTTIELPKFGLEHKARPAVVQALEDNGIPVANERRDKVVVKMPKVDYATAMKTFWNVVDTIEAMGPDFNHGGRQDPFGLGKQTNIKYYERAARMIYTAFRTNSRDLLPRGGTEGGTGTYDINDKLITTGITEEGYKVLQAGGNPYREHAVPSHAINVAGIEMCKQMKKDRVPESEQIWRLANMIKNNLCIVLCSTAEAKGLDKVHQSTMPSSWTPENGNIYARFKDAGIPVYAYNLNTRTVGKQIAETI